MISAVAMAAAVAGLAVSGAQAARSGSTDQEMGIGIPADWDTFTVDITLRRSRTGVDAARDVPSVRRTRYHLERTLGASGWRTVVSMTGMDRPEVSTPLGPRPVSNPFHIGRVEFDESGTPPTVYDVFGRVIAPLSEDQLQKWTTRARIAQPDLAALVSPLPGAVPVAGPPEPPSRDWIDQLLPSAERRMLRWRAVQERFGQVAGIERGLERYVSAAGDVVHELLLDPRAATPVEMNTVRAGRLQSHTAFVYLPRDDGRLALDTVRVETALDEATGARAVTELEYANMRFGAGGR